MLNIGVFADENKFNLICDSMKPLLSSKTRIDDYEYEEMSILVELKDGSTLHYCDCDDRSRGLRFDVIYIDKKYIDTEFLNDVAIPTLRKRKQENIRFV